MLLNGWAWVLERYGPDEIYFEALEIAQRNKRGIWAYDDNVHPWTFKGQTRKKIKNVKMSSGRLCWKLGKTQREVRSVLWMLKLSELYVHTFNIKCWGRRRTRGRRTRGRFHAGQLRAWRLDRSSWDPSIKPVAPCDWFSENQRHGAAGIGRARRAAPAKRSGERPHCAAPGQTNSPRLPATPRRPAAGCRRCCTDTLRLVRSGRSADWLISKNPACEAAAREAEEYWGRPATR